MASFRRLLLVTKNTRRMYATTSTQTEMVAEPMNTADSPLCLPAGKGKRLLNSKFTNNTRAKNSMETTYLALMLNENNFCMCWDTKCDRQNTNVSTILRVVTKTLDRWTMTNNLKHTYYSTSVNTSTSSNPLLMGLNA